ncbi:MAG: alpha/beta fold hydrolase [Rudaea sp.]|uniref:alpha/beta fold hydrolase n=1 Tax=Rudaea sp. TaxID=2136325 RepID=UPI0039E63529
MLDAQAMNGSRHDAQTCPAASHVGGHGSTLVLLHGLTGSWEIRRPVLPLLERHHRVVAVTLPGHHGGPAFRGPGDATLAAIADQLADMLRAQGIDRAHIVGNSLGGWLSIEVARRGFARSVVALSPAGGWRTPGDYLAVARPFRLAYSTVDGVRFALRPFFRFERTRRALLGQIMEHGERVPASVLESMLAAMSNTVVLPGLLRTFGRDGPVQPLRIAGTPIRIAWAERDRVIPFERYGRPFVERIDGAELVRMPGVGHVPMYDDPALVAETILAVTRRVDGSP